MINRVLDAINEFLFTEGAAAPEEGDGRPDRRGRGPKFRNQFVQLFSMMASVSFTSGHKIKIKNPSAKSLLISIYKIIDSIKLVVYKNLKEKKEFTLYNIKNLLNDLLVYDSAWPKRVLAMQKRRSISPA